MFMKTGTKNLGADLKVMQNSQAVPVWHYVELVSPVVNTAPAESPLAISSSQSSAMELGMQIARSEPETRSTLIEAIMAQIEAGTYAVDSQAIAQKMLMRE
jgi:flagellar biosynthesis anti-sigma factor FlgM